MELTQQMLDIPIEHMSNVFGKFDAWLKQIEKYLQVTMVVRDGSLKIMGNDNNVQKAQSVMSDLLAMSRKAMISQSRPLLMHWKCADVRKIIHC